MAFGHGNTLSFRERLVRRADPKPPNRGGPETTLGWARRCFRYSPSSRSRLEYEHVTRNNWRASLVPAAAVIPAPIAYIKVVAVKKLVVEPWAWLSGPPHRVHWFGWAFPSGEPHALHWVCRGSRTFTLKKLECSKQAYARIH